MPSLPSCTSCRSSGRGAGRAVEVRQHGLVDREREIRADEIRILERTEHGQAAAKARLHHGIDSPGIAHPVLHQRDRFAPERMLQAIADEAGHILLDRDRRLAGSASAAPSSPAR